VNDRFTGSIWFWDELPEILLHCRERDLLTWSNGKLPVIRVRRGTTAELRALALSACIEELGEFYDD